MSGEFINENNSIYKRIYSISILISYIDKSMAEIEKRGPNTHGEESVLEKLLKIDKKVAIIMALDMLMAGVDTVCTCYLIREKDK